MKRLKTNLIKWNDRQVNVLEIEDSVVEELYQLYVANGFTITSESEDWDNHKELFCAIESHIREHDLVTEELFWELDSNRTEF